MSRRFPAPWHEEKNRRRLCRARCERPSLGAHLRARYRERGSTSQGAHNGRGTADRREYREAAGAIERSGLNYSNMPVRQRETFEPVTLGHIRSLLPGSARLLRRRAMPPQRAHECRLARAPNQWRQCE
jgi:hypothetical protein